MSPKRNSHRKPPSAQAILAALLLPLLSLPLAAPEAWAQGRDGGKAASAGLELDTVDPVTGEVCATAVAMPVCAAGVLSGAGTLRVTNDGEVAGQVSSVALVLEARDPAARGRDKFVPVRAATAALAPACDALGEARTCDGAVLNSAGALLSVADLPSVEPTLFCDGVVEVPFSYSFDLTGLALAEGDSLRASVVVTWAPGRANKSCDLDADCDGLTDADAAGDPVPHRTSEERFGFALPACD